MYSDEDPVYKATQISPIVPPPSSIQAVRKMARMPRTSRPSYVGMDFAKNKDTLDDDIKIRILSFTDDATLVKLMKQSGKLKEFIRKHKQKICELKLGGIWTKYKDTGMTPCELYLNRHEMKTPDSDMLIDDVDVN